MGSVGGERSPQWPEVPRFPHRTCHVKDLLINPHVSEIRHFFPKKIPKNLARGEGSRPSAYVGLVKYCIPSWKGPRFLLRKPRGPHSGALAALEELSTHFDLVPRLHLGHWTLPPLSESQSPTYFVGGQGISFGSKPAPNFRSKISFPFFALVPPKCQEKRSPNFDTTIPPPFQLQLSAFQHGGPMLGKYFKGNEPTTSHLGSTKNEKHCRKIGRGPRFLRNTNGNEPSQAELSRFVGIFMVATNLRPDKANLKFGQGIRSLRFPSGLSVCFNGLVGGFHLTR